MAKISDYRDLINEARQMLKSGCGWCGEDEGGEFSHLNEQLLELILKIDAGEFGS